MDLLLLDVRPDPVPVGGTAGLILLTIVVVMFSGALIVGLVFLLKRLARRSGSTVNQHPQPNNPNQL
jgi:hypothetical protein